jgi:hypothetical protein
MPYDDMISWALENIDVQTRSIFNHQKVVVGSIRLEHLQAMYKLSPNPKYSYNVAFMLCWVCVIFFARVVVSERLRRARRGVRGGAACRGAELPVRKFGGSAP